MICLKDFLANYVDRHMVWGVDDCSLMIADWWQANHGIDPASHLRGTYSTEAEKISIVQNSGGIVSLISSIARTVGAGVSAANETGAFAVIAVPDHQAVAAIRDGKYWAVRSTGGVAFTSKARLIKGWSI